MDVKEKIQLNETRNVDAINVDTTVKLNLQSNNALNIEYDLQNVLDVSQIFDEERQASTIYRIYGSFNYFSLLHGIKRDYALVEDFFVKPLAGTPIKNAFTDLNIYLVKPASEGYVQLNSNPNRYIKKYEVITKITDIGRAGFNKDMFGEQQYSIISNVDVDIRDIFDSLGFPITDLALYVEYIPKDNVNTENDDEEMQKKVFNLNGGTNIVPFNPIPLNVGDIIDGNLIEYNEEEFLQTDVDNIEHYIFTPLGVGNDIGGKSVDDEDIKWKYNPLIPIKLRYFESDLSRANTGTSSYDEITSIPDYAKELSEGNFIWRNIIENGFIDPIENIGVSFPFINQKHYVFNNFVFKIQPDLSHPFTNALFDETLFPANALDSTTPNSDLNDIGKLCS